MSAARWEITRHVKKQDSSVYTETESIVIDSAMTYIIEFIDKDIKAVFVIIFHLAKKLEERLTVLHSDMEDKSEF